MRDNNKLYNHSKKFAIRIIHLGEYLLNKKDRNTILTIIVKQILRSGTSIGANISESISAQSTPDFIAKLHIALKEGDETKYWLELLHETDYLTEDEFNSIYGDLKIINGMLTNNIKKVKENIDTK
ncbi:MAG: four helix bundle protein [Prevotella sp.]|nr:four helix bundle protein [Prevotella sp.]